MITVRCHVCKRSIAAGIEAKKMIAEYVQSDGSSRTYGFLMPDGPLTAAIGRLHRGWHHKCFHAERKRQIRQAADQHATADQQAADQLAVIQARRDDDPGHSPPEDADWRDQIAIDVAELT